MTRTKKHEKTTNPEMPCDCPWCNPEKARSEYLHKRAKKDFDTQVKMSEGESYDKGYYAGVKVGRRITIAAVTAFINNLKDLTSSEVKDAIIELLGVLK